MTPLFSKVALPLAAVVLGATAAAAQGVPTLNLTAVCRPLGDNDFSMQIDTQRCMRSENEARDKLAKDWSKYKASDRSLCTETAKLGGMESYVQLITCLELQVDVEKGRDRAAASARSTGGSPMRTRPAGLPEKSVTPAD
jgi:hypothetical protein